MCVEHAIPTDEEGSSEDEGVARRLREPHAEAQGPQSLQPDRWPEELGEGPPAEAEGPVESLLLVRDGTRLRPTLREELLPLLGGALVNEKDREVVPGLAERAE